MEFLLSFFIGIGVGLASVFFGLGGGIVIVPLLPLVATISTREVIGTSLMTVALVAAANTWSFHRQKLIEWRVAILIGCFSAIGAFISGKLTLFIPEVALKLVFATLLFFLGWKTFHHSRRLSAAAPPVPQLKSPVVGALGFCSGLISGLTGVGGGLFVVPLLSMLRATEPRMMVPTSVATVVLTSAAGALAFLEKGGQSQSSAFSGLSSGDVRLDLAGAIFLGGILASVLSRPYQSRLSARKRDWLMGLILLALSIRMIVALLTPFHL